MNFFQRIKAAFSSAVAFVFARYEAAQGWRRDFTYLPGSTQDARFDASAASRTELMRLARYFEKNSAVAQAIGATWECFTVGAGLVVKPNSSEPKWNEAATRYWNQTTPFIDIRSRQNFGTLQGMIAWRWLFDGEIFILKTRGQAANSRTYPRIQLIESHLVGTPPDKAAQEGKTIVDGVAIDGDGRPTGYYVKSSSDSTTYRLVEAQDMIHVFEPSRPGEYRGITFLHAVLDDFRRLVDLELLEMRAAVDAAEKSTFIKNAAGEIPIQKLMQQRLSGSSYVADQSGDLEKRVEFTREAHGGRMSALKIGEDVVQFQPTRPTEATRALWDYLLTKVCIGIGIPKLLVIQHSLQGTVVRGCYDVANAFFQNRSAVISAACREVYIYVIGWGTRSEKSLADPPADWFNVSVRAPRSVNVDVGRNSAAMVNELRNGCTNYDLIYSPLGLDWQEELKKLHDQLEFIHGLCSTGKTTPAEMIEAAADAADAAAKTAKLQQEETANREREDAYV